jgi:hypothetical protein
MTQADSVHSTPPTKTSASNPTGGPESPQDSFYLPTDVSSEKVFQAIGRLRKEARDEVDRLISFLDKTDDYMFRELEDSVDDHPHGDEGEAEPSLGWTEQEARWNRHVKRHASPPFLTGNVKEQRMMRNTASDVICVHVLHAAQPFSEVNLAHPGCRNPYRSPGLLDVRGFPIARYQPGHRLEALGIIPRREVTCGHFFTP